MVIAIMGILFGIAMSLWNSVVESRRVDSAANQLASDMRLAHNRATNQLTDWRVELNPGSPDYELQKLAEPHEAGEPDPTVEETVTRSLPEGTKVLSTTADPGNPSPFIELNSDGSLYVVNGPNGNVKVSATDDDPIRSMTYLSATSRIKLD